MKPSLSQIRARWRWDKPPIKATAANIRRAIRRTRNRYGITVSGMPYVKPWVGMRIRYHCSMCHKPEEGVIIGLCKAVFHGTERPATIRTACGRTIYLIQTAFNGYTFV
jgi:hypothetical protein